MAPRHQAWKISGGLNGGNLADLSDDVYYGAFALDFADSVASMLDAKYKFASKIANSLGGVFAVLGVLVDLASAITTIADIAKNCKNGLKNPAVQRAMDAIVALTVVSIVMTTALGIASVLGGAVGGVVFAVLSNVFSAMYNKLVAHTATLAIEECRK